MFDNKTDFEVTGGPVPEGFLTTKRRLLGEHFKQGDVDLVDPIPKMDDFKETSIGGRRFIVKILKTRRQDVFVDSFVNGEHQLAGDFSAFHLFLLFSL